MMKRLFEAMDIVPDRFRHEMPIKVCEWSYRRHGKKPITLEKGFDPHREAVGSHF
jgi:hypothetical protein